MHQHPHSVAVRHVEEGRLAVGPERQGQHSREAARAHRRRKSIGIRQGAHRGLECKVWWILISN